MMKEEPFSATFKQEKETKNTVRYARSQKTVVRWWVPCTLTSTSCQSPIQSGFG